MSKQFLFIIAISTIIWNQQIDYFDHKITIENAYRDIIISAVSHILTSEKFVVVVNVELSTSSGAKNKISIPSDEGYFVRNIEIYIMLDETLATNIVKQKIKTMIKIMIPETKNCDDCIKIETLQFQSNRASNLDTDSQRLKDLDTQLTEVRNRSNELEAAKLRLKNLEKLVTKEQSVTLESESHIEYNSGRYLQNEFEKERKSLYLEYKLAKNEIKKSAVFNKSRKETCEFKDKYGQHFVNWYGELTYLSTDQGGDRVSIELTSNNQQIKVEYENFGIKMGSVVYNEVAEFAVGDYVFFNFYFLSAEAINSSEYECFNEKSWTELGSLEQPEFDVVFSRIGLKPVP